MPLLALGLLALTTSNDMGCSRSGMKGHVYLVKGNQMPSPDRPPSTPQGFETELFIYELTNLEQVTRVGSTSFYSQINTPLVKTIKTDASGAFSIKLPPGNYSLFVKKDGNFYANLFDAKNNIYPVEVLTGKYTDVEFRADYDAVY
ncbi:carboxypeptidase-like regulatory domain-containing protein [Terrimonas sp. NA20]|uniref:Carboxypeptidase-like regulatory domain-containing protein n=1 Tax=Terrimonas ginsenosidimutans TaxID=2908004 RepID=A0ABS9KZU0_9BACT|nr:carboxypeptidase-like regulatory domain-containing protein [Terrimonas ginsenosidimutans]MCG2617860.1 carboxypeptidase-like regulatory domain-containing protein [Terrimonas ginsenosidimutans]